MKTSLGNRRLSRRGFLQAAGALTGSWLLPQGIARGQESARYPVAIGQVDSYDRKAIHDTVYAMLDDLGGLGDVVRPGDKVAIKINLTGGSGSMQAVNIPATEYFVTHPDVVRALCEAVSDAGAGQIYIVEAAWDRASWQVAGFRELVDDFNLDYIDLNSPAPYKGFVEMPVGDGGLIYDSFLLNGILSDVDVFMSVPKMKCHSGCGVTHAMKNLVGIVPISKYKLSSGDGRRSALHGIGDEYKTRLPRVVVDLNRVRPIDFALIDGIKTSQGGEGPWVPSFRPIAPHVLLAGKNPVATDAAATAAMNFDPEAESLVAVPFDFCENHLQLAADAGLGSNRLDDIEVIGATLDEVRVSFGPAVAMG